MEYWLKEFQESMDRCTGHNITEILLKIALNTERSVNQSKVSQKKKKWDWYGKDYLKNGNAIYFQPVINISAIFQLLGNLLDRSMPVIQTQRQMSHMHWIG